LVEVFAVPGTRDGGGDRRRRRRSSAGVLDFGY